MRTEVGAAAGDPGFDDDGATAWTGLAFAAEDAGKAGVATFLALGINVVPIC